MAEREFRPAEILIDRGFDGEFSWERINQLCRLFSDDEVLQEFIYKSQIADNALDLKRGEFYPEILRAVLSLKRTLSTVYDIDLLQVHPNFGSNGSIDTILAAAKVQETRQQAQFQKAIFQAIAGIIESKLTSDEKIREISRISAELETKRPRGGALFTSPTYFRNYNSAAAKQLAIHLVPLKEDFEFNAAKFVAEMKRLNPTVVFLVTPNNPTGLTVADEEITLVLDNLPEGCWVVIDRTLVNTRPEATSRELLHRYPHKDLIILHSFSKYRGMSHHRIGVALYSNQSLARTVQPHLPLGLGLEGCIKANKIVLDEGGLFPTQRVLANIRANRATLADFVRQQPSFSFTDFAGNYGLLLLPRGLESMEVSSELASHGLFAMGGHDFPERNTAVVRLHTGGPPEYFERMCKLLAARFGQPRDGGKGEPL